MKTKEYSVLELCEQKWHVKLQTFKNNPDRYWNELKKENHVEFVKKRPIIVAVTPIGKSPKQVENERFLEIIGCGIGKLNIDLLKFILKAILEKKIVPGHNEIAHHANVAGIKTSQTAVTNYMAFLKEQNIIVEPIKIPVWDNDPAAKRVFDKETGEIYPTYFKSIVNRIYFDFAKDEISFNRFRLPKLTQNALELAYNNLWPEVLQEKIYPLYALGHDEKFITKERIKAQKNLIRKIGKAFGINYCVRMDEPIINPEVKRKLKGYFDIK